MSVVHFLQAWFLAWKKKISTYKVTRIWRNKLHYTSMPYSTAMTWVEENEVWLLASTVSMETVNTRTVFLFAKCNRVRPSPPPSPQQNVLMWHWLTMQLIYPFLILHIFMCSVLLVSRDAFATSHNFLTTNTVRMFDYLTGL